ncbi:MAG: hypothetical protein AB7S75_13320 [Desulfococcaceae bacterium]
MNQKQNICRAFWNWQDKAEKAFSDYRKGRRLGKTDDMSEK